jgi:predicted amidohydrolase
MMRARAIENKVWLVAANYAQRGEEAGAVHIGRSAIVDWAGMVVADTGRREGVATATVDLGESKEVFGWPADLLSRRRPETYRGLGTESEGGQR